MTINKLIWDDAGTLSSEDISLVEQKFAIKFSDDFKNILISYDGASPDLPCIDFGGMEEKVFSGLIQLLGGHDYSIIGLMADKDINLPNDIVPFGNLYCFDPSGPENNTFQY